MLLPRVLICLLTAAPRWVSLDLGVFLCVTCAGIHRTLGEGLCRVRPMTMEKIDRDTVKVEALPISSLCDLSSLQFLTSQGNERINNEYESTLKSSGRPDTGDIL